MALSLSCTCGAAFEVEDTFAGHGVACPDCGAALKAPPLRPPRLRTSGYALASVVLALVGAFTVVGTALAAALGVVALVSIARHRDRVGGAGYAVLGIVLGAGLTVLTGFAFSRGEVFDRLRAQVASAQIDTKGPLKVERPKDGYAITRPSRAWGVATAEYARDLGAEEGDLLLVNPAKNAYLQVKREDPGPVTLDQYRDAFLDQYRDEAPAGRNNKKGLEEIMRFTDFRLREARRLPAQDGSEVEEVAFDVKRAGQNLTYRARLVRPKDGTKVYAVLAWAHRRRLEMIEPEVREAMDSFRLLN